MLVVQICLYISAHAETNIENWKTKLKGSIFSTPLIRNNTIYVGTEDGFFYKIEATNGTILRKSKISSPIRSNALVYDGKIYFESLGKLFCLDEATLKKIYLVSPPEENLDMVDPWDYFHSSPTIHNGNIYYAGNKGKIYIIDPKNGAIVKTISTSKGAPIRSELTFYGDNLLFGDNNGIIYEYNLSTNSFPMVYSTFTKRPYSTYGYITGGPIIQDEKLFFGSRHESFTVLNLKTQSIIWNHSDSNGSWWPAVPTIVDGKVIIGGSDNLLLTALSLDSGKICWEDTVDYNNFCKPLLTDNILIIGTGDSYLNRKGDGSIYSINTENGKRINKYKPDGNVFSSLVVCGDNIIICTTSGYITSVRKTFFTSPSKSEVLIKGDCNFVFENESPSVLEKQLNIITSGESANRISCSFTIDSNFPDSLIKIEGEKDWVYTSKGGKIYFQLNRSTIKPGKYKGELSIKLNDGEKTLKQPFSITIKGNPKSDEQAFEIEGFESDNKNESISFELRVSRKINISTYIVYENKDVISGFTFKNIDWGIYRIERDLLPKGFKKLQPGNYTVKFIGLGGTQQFNFIKY